MASSQLTASAPRVASNSNVANHLLIAGAALDTTNLGVSALATALVEAIHSHLGRVAITLLDNGSGIRIAPADFTGCMYDFELCGVRNSWRLYRTDTYVCVRVAAKFGGLLNRVARRFITSDVILDLSGGDSFSDIYGMRRFRTICLPKQMALEAGKPLVLLPQTYGPFKDNRSQNAASSLVKAAAMAWARDARSFSVLRTLLGKDYDSRRHRLGVDLAFGLTPKAPSHSLPDSLIRVMSCEDVSQRPIGVNVSGLIYNNFEVARRQFRLTSGYNRLLYRLLEVLLDISPVPVVLIPHVYANSGDLESDPDACRSLRDSLPAAMRERVYIMPPSFTAAEMKWLIGKFQWFCGTRMHSTIAALGSAVPAAGLAYSDKAQCVFETCGEGDAVVDMRVLDQEESLSKLIILYRERDIRRRNLLVSVPPVISRAKRQVWETLDHIFGQDKMS